MFALLFDLKVMCFDQIDLSRQFVKTEMEFLSEEKASFLCPFYYSFESKIYLGFCVRNFLIARVDFDPDFCSIIALLKCDFFLVL